MGENGRAISGSNIAIFARGPNTNLATKRDPHPNSLKIFAVVHFL
jgi:hypothetical protein